MGGKDEAWRQKIRFQNSPLLLFGALCRDRLQKQLQCSLLSWNRAHVNRNLADTAFPYLQGQTKEKQRKREIQPIYQLWTFLTRVRLGLFEHDLAHRFDVSVSTVSYMVVTWANYLYILPGSLPVWPLKEKIKEHLPDSFKGKYENVRGILDCSELKCELPKDY